MANREIKSTTKVVQLKSYGATTADADSAYVDTRGWDAVLFVVDNGAVTADAPIGTNKFTVSLIHADATPAAVGSYSAAATTDVKGTIAPLGDGNATAAVRTLAYVGNKRYVAVRLDETGTASASIGVYAILQKFGQEPSGDVTVTTGAIS